MRGRDEERGELVMGITLAEVFLLLVFVVWYGAFPKTPGPNGNGPDLRERIARLEKENQDLREKADLLPWYQRLLENLAVSLEVPKKMITPDTVKQVVQEKLKNAKEEGRRGKPACQPNNVLVEIATRDGATTLRMLEALPSDVSTLHSSTSIGGDAIAPFLLAIQRYYDGRARSGQPCAFDAHFLWKTDTDFRMNAERFDPYFYIKTRKQVK